jgi:hypothetical protein
VPCVHKPITKRRCVMEPKDDLSLVDDLAATYVTKIEAAYQEELSGHDRQIGNIIEVGRLILEAKEAVGHGKFMKYVVEQLSFGIDKVEARMTIARCPEIANSDTWRSLPAYASPLEALAKVDKQVGKGTLARLIEEGKIRPDTSKSEIDTIVAGLKPRAEVDPDVPPATSPKRST